MKKKKPDVFFCLCMILGVIILLALGSGVYLWKSISMLSGGEINIIERPEYNTDYSAIDSTLSSGKGTEASLTEDHASAFTQTEEVPIYAAGKMSRYVTNILLVVQEGKTASPVCQADIIMLLSYNEALQKITALSAMRDVWVNVENRGFMRLSESYSAGGMGLLINTMNDYYSLDIQNYAIIGCEELIKIIDCIGGIKVNINKEEAEYLGIEQGEKLLNGEQTLKHAMNRVSGGNGEFSRAGRQCALVESFIRNMRTHFSDEEQMMNLKDFIFSGIETNINLKLLANLGKSVIKADGITFTPGHIPFEGCWDYASKDGETVISVSREKNNMLLKKELFSGK